MSTLRRLVTYGTIGAGTSAVTALASLSVAHRTHELVRPIPVLDVQYERDGNIAAVEVKVKRGSYGPLVDLQYTHTGLDCLAKKGYVTRSYCTAGGGGSTEPILELRNCNAFLEGYSGFMKACKECNASTTIGCRGVPSKTHRWDANTFAH